MSQGVTVVGTNAFLTVRRRRWRTPDREPVDALDPLREAARRIEGGHILFPRLRPPKAHTRRPPIYSPPRRGR